MNTRINARRAADVAALLREAAQAEIMPRFRRLTPGDVRTKTGPLDLVTDADEAAERVIQARLEHLFPGCVVVGEEAAAADSGLLTHLAGADLAFVIDPVDGTANFATGVPLFGTMVGAIARGEVVAGWIYDPLGDDAAIALRGEGAWLQDGAGGRRLRDLRVAAPAPVSRMVAGISWTYLPEPLRGRVAGNLPKLAAALGYRCAAHEYRLVASGGAHALLYNRLMPWDHAAGWLLHREAGGYAARFDGSAYSPLITSGGMICAPDAESWAALRDTLLGA